jgi:RloB-like protein
MSRGPRRDRRHAYSRFRSDFPSSGQSFLIVTEGLKTEPNYLELLRKRLHLAAADVEIVHPNGTDPITLTERAIELRDARKRQARRNHALEYDEVWVVFDLEKPHDQRRQLAERVHSLKGVKGIKFAVSDPAFEYWLLLHYHYTTAQFSDCGALVSRLKEFWTDYDKSRSPSPEFLERIPTAVVRAERCRHYHLEVGGAKNPSTDVDHLVRSLNLATRQHLQFDLPNK